MSKGIWRSDLDRSSRVMAICQESLICSLAHYDCASYLIVLLVPVCCPDVFPTCLVKVSFEIARSVPFDSGIAATIAIKHFHCSTTLQDNRKHWCWKYKCNGSSKCCSPTLECILCQPLLSTTSFHLKFAAANLSFMLEFAMSMWGREEA